MSKETTTPAQHVRTSRVGRRTKVVVATVALLGIAGAAFAYWTGGGDGTGTAGTATGTNALVVNQTSTVANMGPGVAAQDLSGDFDNSNEGPVYVSTVTVSIASISGGTTGCTADDYTLSGAEMTVDAEIPAGDAQGAWSGATIEFNNDPLVNQDYCKGATVHLAYAIA